MGIPYSKEINRAFAELNNAYGQVTPLIESAYEVLETTKNISLLLAAIQILTVILLSLILLALLGLMIVMNPEMETERREIVTPVLKWGVGWVKAMEVGVGWVIFWGVVGCVVLAGVGWGWAREGEWVKRKVRGKMGLEEDEGERDGEGEDGEGNDGGENEDGEGKRLDKK